MDDYFSALRTSRARSRSSGPYSASLGLTGINAQSATAGLFGNAAARGRLRYSGQDQTFPDERGGQNHEDSIDRSLSRSDAAKRTLVSRRGVNRAADFCR